MGMIYVTANGTRVPVMSEDMTEHLRGVERIELSPDGANTQDGNFGGEQARSLELNVEGFPTLLIVMPLAKAQALGEMLSKKTVEIVRTMPSGPIVQ